ncbi:MAG: putative porin [Candidatus Omnitrophota bacterium]|nr:putative porin [Candidatus Omnitrophota bacterium]
MKKTPMMFILCAALTFGSAGPGMADDARLMSMIQNMQTQMEGMQKLIAAQGAEIQALKKQSPERSVLPEPAGNFKENLKASIGDSDRWLKDLDFKGDVRLRYEALDFSDGETVKGTRDRNRFRYRLRFGWDKQLYDDLSLGFWLASGDTAAGTSTNDTLDTDFSKKLIWIERIYVNYTPSYIKGLRITAGKFENPLVSTALVWDSDIRPEGLYEHYKFSLMGGKVSPFVTLGQWILQEDSVGAPGDAELFVYQTGLDWIASDDFLNDQPLKVKLAASYYDFTDYGDSFVAAGGNPLQANGNLAAQDFNLGDVYFETRFTPIKIGDKPVPLKLFAHYIQNFDGSAIQTTTSLDDQDYAYGYGLQVGEIKAPGDWTFYWRYGFIAPNAVPGGLADADFGAANRRGMQGSFTYRLRDNLDFEFTTYLTGNVTGVDTENRTFQSNLLMKF